MRTWRNGASLWMPTFVASALRTQPYRCASPKAHPAYRLRQFSKPQLTEQALNDLLSHISPRLRWSIVVTVFIFAIAHSASAQVTAPPRQDLTEFAGDEIVSVQFAGNHQLSSDELATVTATKVTGTFSRWLYAFILTRPLGEQYMTVEPATMYADTQRLNSHYRDNGFLDAQSYVTIARNREDVKAYYDYIRRERLARGPSSNTDDLPKIHDTVTFHIMEGQPYTISHIAINDLDVLPNEFQPELTENVTIKTGQRWSREANAKEITRLSTLLVENGYPNARADTTVVSHTQGYHTVNVSLYFRPGHRYKYGAIHIDFDSTSPIKARVADDVILAQMFTDSGHWYRLSEVKRSEAALYKLGTFDLARVSLDTDYISRIPDSLRDSIAVPVQVFLRMKARGGVPISLFAGTASQGFVAGGSIGYQNRNLTQTADNFNLQFGIQPLPTTQRRYNGSIDYVRPYIGMGRVPLITGIGASRQNQFPVPNDPNVHTYNLLTYTAHVGSNIITSKNDDRTTVSPDLLIAYVKSEGDTNLPKKQYNVLPSVSYQDDRTNDQLNPTSGDLLSALVEVGVPADNLFKDSTSQYLKFVPQIKEYFDLSGGQGTTVLATRLRIGASYLFQGADHPDHAPSYDHRFFGGGATSFRGWGEQDIIVAHDASWASTSGGFNDLEANIELRYAPFHYAKEFTSWQKLSSALRVVLFYDIGNVWDDVLWTDVNARKFTMLAQTLGVGIRYNLFFGALRVDLGWKLYDPAGATKNPDGSDKGFSSAAETVTPGDKGAWLFSRRIWFAMGHTMNLHFGMSQAF